MVGIFDGLNDTVDGAARVNIGARVIGTEATKGSRGLHAAAQRIEDSAPETRARTVLNHL